MSLLTGDSIADSNCNNMLTTQSFQVIFMFYLELPNTQNKNENDLNSVASPEVNPTQGDKNKASAN